MLKSIYFPYDEFTSLSDIEKIIIKILVAIASISTNVYICKYIYLWHYLLLIIFCIYNTYIIFYKSYCLMNNETNDKMRYSNILSVIIIETLIYFINPEELFEVFSIIF